MRGENAEMFDDLEGRIAKLGCLWIIGGDFNMAPSELAGFASRTRGVVVAPRGITCDAGKGSAIDFFRRAQGAGALGQVGSR